jgi:hypothetical protein
MVVVPRLAMLPPNSDYPGVDSGILILMTRFCTRQAHNLRAFCHLSVRRTSANLRASLHVLLSRE